MSEKTDAGQSVPSNVLLDSVCESLFERSKRLQRNAAETDSQEYAVKCTTIAFSLNEVRNAILDAVSQSNSGSTST